MKPITVPLRVLVAAAAALQEASRIPYTPAINTRLALELVTASSALNYYVEQINAERNVEVTA
jgi:hypothetical protein